MIRFTCSLGVLVLLMLLDAGTVDARDKVYLTNGNVMEGDILERTETGIRIDISGVKLVLQSDAIESVEWDGKKISFTKKEGSKEPTPTQRTEPNPTPVEPTATPDPNAAIVPDATAPIGGYSVGTAVIRETTSEQTEMDPFPYPGKEPLIPIAIPTGRFLVVSRRMVRLREGPSVDFTMTGYLQQGDLLLELEEEDNWYHVEMEDGTKGWVLGELTEPAKSEVVVVTGNRVNVRKGPGSEHDVTCQLSKGDILVRLGLSKDWARVRDLAGNAGWMSNSYLEPIQDLNSIRKPILVLGDKEGTDYLSKALVCHWINSTEPGKKALSLTIQDGDCLRGGQIALLAFRDTPREKGERRTDLFSSDEVSWQQRFYANRDLKDLGLSLALADTVKEVVVVYLRGNKIGNQWDFAVDVDEKEVASNRIGIVIQKGIQRGACAILPNQ